MPRTRDLETTTFVVPLGDGCDQFRDIFDWEVARTDPLSKGRDQTEIDMFCAQFGEATAPGSTLYANLMEFRKHHKAVMPTGIFHVHAVVRDRQFARAAISIIDAPVNVETFYSTSWRLIRGFPERELTWLGTKALPMVNPSVLHVELIVG